LTLGENAKNIGWTKSLKEKGRRRGGGTGTTFTEGNIKGFQKVAIKGGDGGCVREGLAETFERSRVRSGERRSKKEEER